jgi:tetratricopeptide (TPR) repeat protein
MLAWNYMSHTDAPWREIGSAAEDVREVLSITTVAFLCAGILFACAILSAGAQAPSRLAESPTTSLTRKLNRAIAMAERGDPQQAMVLADALLERHPDFVPALKLKGMLLEEMGRGAEASGVYERALKLAPNDPGLLFKLAVMRLAAGDNDQAIQLFLRHLRILLSCPSLSPERTGRSCPENGSRVCQVLAGQRAGLAEIRRNDLRLWGQRSRDAVAVEGAPTRSRTGED